MNQPIDTTPVSASSLTGTAYTPSRSDAGRVLEAANVSAVTITLPAAATVGWHVGTVLQVFQQGAGQVTLSGAAGVTLRSNGGKLKTAGQYAVLFLRMRANDEWVVWGDTTA